MSEQEASLPSKPLLVVKYPQVLTREQMETATRAIEEVAAQIGAEGLALCGDVDVAVHPSGLSDLIAAMKAQTQSNLELAGAIRLQADAIADLVEAVASQNEDDEEGPGHLGVL